MILLDIEVLRNEFGSWYLCRCLLLLRVDNNMVLVPVCVTYRTFRLLSVYLHILPKESGFAIDKIYFEVFGKLNSVKFTMRNIVKLVNLRIRYNSSIFTLLKQFSEVDTRNNIQP